MIPLTVRKLAETMGSEIPYELVFVDDGSRDKSWDVICALAQEDPHILGIHFSRNFGKEAAIFEVLKAYIKESKPIRFDGNGYSDEWKEEAAKRGLDCQNSVPLQYDAYLKPESIEMFTSTGGLTQKELEARNEVKWEVYIKKVQIEARVLGDLSLNHIIPVATQYQTDLIDNVYKMKDLFPGDKAAKLSAKNLELIEEIADRTAFIKEHVDAMIEARKVANKIESEREKAIAYHDNIVPMMEEIRYHIDKLELIVDNQMWTLPKYRELLFIR